MISYKWDKNVSIQRCDQRVGHIFTAHVQKWYLGAYSRKSGLPFALAT